MAAKTAAPFGSVPMRTIDQHATAKGTPPAVELGTMAMEGWTSGIMVSAEEYDAAITRFLKSAMGKRG